MAPSSGNSSRLNGPSVHEADLWAYAVRREPGAPHFVGVHTGGPRAWALLERQLNGYRYRDGYRLRQFASGDEAVRGYMAEADVHGTLVDPLI